MLQYADPKKQEEADLRFDPAQRNPLARYTSASSPLGKLVSAFRQSARDVKLTERQLAYRDWTEKFSAIVSIRPCRKT